MTTPHPHTHPWPPLPPPRLPAAEAYFSATSRVAGARPGPPGGTAPTAWTHKQALRSGPPETLSECDNAAQVAPRTSHAVLSALQASEAVLRRQREPLGLPQSVLRRAWLVPTPPTPPLSTRSSGPGVQEK